MTEETHILNPATSRYVRVGSDRYKKLVREGVLKPAAPSPTPAPVTVAASAKPTPVPSPDPPKPRSLKKELVKLTTDIVRDNKRELVDLSQKETDAYIRRMLYEKLCVNGNKKIKKKKKKYHYISDSESESDESD